MVELIEADSISALLGPFLKHLVVPSTVPPIKEVLLDLSEGKLQSLVEGFIQTKKAKLVYLKYLTYIPEKFALTWEEAWVLVFDLTEYKENESMLNEKASKNEFLIDLLTHDLRNYHMIIQGYIDFIVDKRLNKHENILDFLSEANSSVKRASKLVDDVSLLLVCLIKTKNIVIPKSNYLRIYRLLQKDAVDIFSNFRHVSPEYQSIEYLLNPKVFHRIHLHHPQLQRTKRHLYFVRL